MERLVEKEETFVCLQLFWFCNWYPRNRSIGKKTGLQKRLIAN